jgi:hypothetical protein
MQSPFQGASEHLPICKSRCRHIAPPLQGDVGASLPRLNLQSIVHDSFLDGKLSQTQVGASYLLTGLPRRKGAKASHCF